MIYLNNITKYYPVKNGRKYIFKNVTLELPTEKNLGILGRNGVGKSTFLRILGGIDFPNSGRIESSVRFSWPLGLSSGFQGSLTGKDNAKFICQLYNKSETEINQTLAFIEDFAEIGKYFTMPIKTYSSGMRARLAFAVSMAFDFDCYLIDELLSVGDVFFRKKSTAVLNNLRSGRNIFLVSHSMIVLRQMCDAGVLLNNGQLTFYEDINEAVSAYENL